MMDTLKCKSMIFQLSKIGYKFFNFKELVLEILFIKN